MAPLKVLEKSSTDSKEMLSRYKKKQFIENIIYNIYCIKFNLQISNFNYKQLQYSATSNKFP